MATPSLPEISLVDLKDPTLGKLNRNFKRIWEKVVSVFGGSGPVNFSNTVIAPDMQIPSQTQPPTNQDSLLTLRSGLALFAPGNQRPALTAGAFQTSSTDVKTVQPLASTGGGFSGTIVGTFTLDGNPVTDLTFTAGVLTRVQ